MKSLLLCALVAVAHAATIQSDFPAAKAAAAAQKGSIAVLVIGSDWCRPAQAYADVWNAPAFAKSLPDSLVLLTIDRKETLTKDEQALAEKNKDCPQPLRSVPALVFLDSEGRVIGARSGVPDLGTPQRLAEQLKIFLTIQQKRDEAWKRADQVQGVKRAEALGLGLDMMNQGSGHAKVYQPVLEEIKKADPQDQSGYWGKYHFPGQDLAAQITENFVSKKDFAGGEAELLRWARNKRLSPEQRQHLHAARFALYRAWPEKAELARTALEDMRATNPRSPLGIAAMNYLKELYPPLSLDRGWRPQHFTAARSKWKIDVSAVIKEQKTYTLTFQYTAGADALQIHGARLVDRQGVLASDGHDGSTGSQNNNNVYQFEVKRRPVGQVFLHTEVEAGSKRDSSGTIKLE